MGAAVCDTTNATSTATQLCCTMSAAAAASVAVSVHVPALGYALATSAMPSFTYVPALAVAAISPAVGHADSTITLTMDRLSEGVVPTVALGHYACGSVSVVDVAESQSNVTCVAMSAPPGVVAVTVHVPDVGLADVPVELTFEYLIAIAAISPAAGSAGGGTLVTVSGHGFEFLPTSATVTIGERSCAVTSHNPTEITCVTPPLVQATTGVQGWLNNFYPQPPASPPPSPPPLPVRSFPTTAAAPRLARSLSTHPSANA